MNRSSLNDDLSCPNILRLAGVQCELQFPVEHNQIIHRGSAMQRGFDARCHVKRSENCGVRDCQARRIIQEFAVIIDIGIICQARGELSDVCQGGGGSWVQDLEGNFFWEGCVED